MTAVLGVHFLSMPRRQPHVMTAPCATLASRERSKAPRGRFVSLPLSPATGMPLRAYRVADPPDVGDRCAHRRAVEHPAALPERAAPRRSPPEPVARERG